MLADIAQKYYLEGDFNCAESVLLAANEAYGFGLDEQTCIRLLGAFGGGMGCGLVCGAVAGAMSAVGYAAIEQRAHATEGFKDLCAGTVKLLENRLTAIDCAKVKPVFFSEGTRCLGTVRAACDVLEKQMDAIRTAKA